MTLQQYLKVLRSRWITVCVTALFPILGALAYSLVQTPLYQASTRLFVSTTAGSSASELYSGNRLSQDRVQSYTQLVMGETLAQRTIDRLNLDMTGAALKANVTAKSTTGTVLIDVSVLDPSPVRARDIANALSDEFVVMVRELETPAQGATPEARVVVEQRASVPPSPTVPKTKRNLAIGLLVGAMLGVGVALLRDQLDSTIKNAEALEDVSGTGVIGYVPFDKKLATGHHTIAFETENNGTAEGFRKLRTNLQFLAVDNPPRLIVVTSSSLSEGKSTTCINIALALAEANRSVLLVDGDLRRPRIGKYLGLVEAVGFSTVLSSGASLDDVLQQTKFPHLTVLTAGTIPPNPSELLGSLAAKKLLGVLRDRFDYVIVDSPPLLAVTDGAILAAEADGAIVAVRAGKTKQDQLAHAIGILRDVDARLLGAVLTMLPARGSGSYSYNYAYYGKTYGDEQQPESRPSQRLLRGRLRLASPDQVRSQHPSERVR